MGSLGVIFLRLEKELEKNGVDEMETGNWDYVVVDWDFKVLAC